MTPQLRPYQQIMVANVRASYAAGHRRVLLQAPTGAGKTVCFAHIGTNAAARGKRVVITAHRVEIIDQISAALDRMQVRHGRIQPGHSMTADAVQVGMVQSIARRLEQIPAPDLLVVDEAHHGVAGTWKQIAEAWATARHLGVTATPQRMDGRGLGAAFDHLIVGPSVRELIDGGHLAPYDYLAPPTVADFSGVETRAGDYAIDQLAKATDRASVTGDVIEHYRQHLNGRPAIAFCVNIAHAEHVAAQFAAAGFRAASVDGGMLASVRRDRLASIGDGRLNVLASCDLISEGTDIPVVSGAILLRKTKSLGLHLQQIGRVLRVKPDGSRAVILDHVGNVTVHGMPCDDRQWSLDAKKQRPKPPAIRQCETCFRAFPGVQARIIAAAECGNEACPILSAKEAVPFAPPESVPGVLTRIEPTKIATLPLRQVLAECKTREDYEAVRRARKYHPAWTAHVMRERAGVAA